MQIEKTEKYWMITPETEQEEAGLEFLFTAFQAYYSMIPLEDVIPSPRPLLEAWIEAARKIKQNGKQ